MYEFNHHGVTPLDAGTQVSDTVVKLFSLKSVVEADDILASTKCLSRKIVRPIISW